MELSLKSLFRDFNASKFVVYLSVLVFCLLLALRLDEVIALHYAFVFMPLWICAGFVFVGSIIGTLSYCIRPPPRTDVVLHSDFWAMQLTAAEHILLLCFEVLCCGKLEDPNALPWLLAFTPLLLLSLLSIIVAIWSIRHEKSFEFELFFSINVVQFVFLAFKLDNTVDWNWAIVLIPAWVVLSLSAVAVLYGILLAVLLTRSMDLVSGGRARQQLAAAAAHCLLVLPLLAFLLLLTARLDHPPPPPPPSYLVLLTPLLIALFCLTLMSMVSKPGNPFWFGIRKSFCHALLDACPFLKQYGNVSYKFGGLTTTSPSTVDVRGELQHLQQDMGCRIPLRPVQPVNSIENPD